MNFTVFHHQHGHSLVAHIFHSRRKNGIIGKLGPGVQILEPGLDCLGLGRLTEVSARRMTAAETLRGCSVQFARWRLFLPNYRQACRP
jgi:hypothetical protein